MWGWLKPLLEVLAKWLEEQARKPDTIEDANTPPDIRQRWAARLRERLRDQNSGH